MSLAAFQREFLEALRRPEQPGEARMNVYRRTREALHGDALAAAYPVVRRLVGATFFDALVQRYARSHPSRSGDLHRFGDALPEFLAADSYAASLAYLPDVARLEWAVHEAEVAPDPVPFDFHALARVPASRHGELRFTLQEGARVVRSAHPIVLLWEANQEGCDGTPRGFPGAQSALVLRDAAAVACRLLGAEAELLERLAAGALLAEAIAGLPPEAIAALPGLVASGAFRHAWV